VIASGLTIIGSPLMVSLEDEFLPFVLSYFLFLNLALQMCVVFYS
jgi:hypothetical protein